MRLRSALYALARLLGDYNAIKRGPKAIVKRQVRKTLLRATSREINRLTR